VWSTDYGRKVVEELRREAPNGHQLANVEVAAVAIRRPLKETIYFLSEDQRWAWVHLTWYAESDPSLPSVVSCVST